MRPDRIPQACAHLCDAAGRGLTFHDLRHEAAPSFLRAVKSDAAAAITNHKALQISNALLEGRDLGTLIG